MQKNKFKDDQYLSSKIENTPSLFQQSDNFEDLECDCFFCDDIFKNNFDVENHLSSCKSKHFSKKSEKNRENNEVLQCDICKTLFVTKCGLRNHAVIFHENISCNLRCHKCGNILKFTCDFKGHMKECEENCNKISTKSILNIANNSKIRISCDICKKSFMNQNCLSKHIREHQNSERTSQLDELGHKIYNFSCKDCKVLFPTKVSLLKHVKKHKELIVKIACTKCTKIFKTRRGLAIHMNKIHLAKKTTD